MWDYLSRFTVYQLRERLSNAGLQKSGKKYDLIERLKEHLRSEKVSNNVEKMKQLMYDYFSNIENYGDKKLIDKFNIRILRKLESKGMTKKQYVDYLFNLAEKRIRSNGTNVFLMNIGSSGSHWIEAMLEDYPGISCVNEVYFPKILRKKVVNFDSYSLNLMMNVINLAHLKQDEESHFDKIIVNSAHVLGTDFYKKCDIRCMCIMLARDPYDIVVSRTFRKDAYREYIAPEATDLEYLNLNIFRVNRFYTRNPESDFNAVVKYEDFIQNGDSALRDLLRIIGVREVDEGLIEEIIYKHDRNNILSGKSKNSANLFTGKRKNVPELMRGKIIQDLDNVRRLLGYV